jgi:hypothetical protein
MTDSKNTYNDAGEPRHDEDNPTKDRTQKNEPRPLHGQDHSAGYVPGQTASQGQGEEKILAPGMGRNYGGTTDEEQEGQKVNVEQAHQTNTAQYKGKPGVKAPSPGKEQGTAWSQDMEYANPDAPDHETKA